MIKRIALENPKILFDKNAINSITLKPARKNKKGTMVRAIIINTIESIAKGMLRDSTKKDFKDLNILRAK